MLSSYIWHRQRSSAILECFIVSSVAKDCLVLSQYDLHHGTFLLVTPIVMSSNKSTIINCKTTSLQWHAVLSKLCLKVKKISTLPPYVADVSFVKKLGEHLLWGWRLPSSFGQCFAPFIGAPANSLVCSSTGFLSAREISEAFKVMPSNLTSQ